MNIYIDESGSINNHDPRNNFFVIALVRADNTARLGRTYKRFVSSHIERLKELDADRFDSKGRLQRAGGKMFRNGKFYEIKGAMLDRDLKSELTELFRARDASCPKGKKMTSTRNT